MRSFQKSLSSRITRKKRKRTSPPMRLRFFVADGKKFTRRTGKKAAESLDIFQPDRFGLVIDHFIKVLITHPHLFIQPIFCFPLFFQKRQNIQAYHLPVPQYLLFALDNTYFWALNYRLIHYIMYKSIVLMEGEKLMYCVVL